MKKSVLFLILIITISVNCYSQFSKTHYIPPLSGSSNLSANPEEQYLYISTPSTTPVQFKIKNLGGTTIKGTVSRAEPYVHYIGYGNGTQLHIDASVTSTVSNNKGYIVEADDMIYVSARVTAGNGNQAGELVSKGIAALGNRFRIGAYTNKLTTAYSDFHTTFISVLATENNTTVNFSDIKQGVSITNNPSVGNTPPSVVLNSGESYVIAVQGPNPANKDGLIGSLVTSNKPIAVNCGSFAGSNGEMDNIDLGFDQIVDAERTGTEYIFIKSTGTDNVERILLVADENNTRIYLNGAISPTYTLNAGQYISINGASYNADGNLYVKTTKKVFAYQSVGDNSLTTQANQELFFVPPLSCQTPKKIDNIPFIDSIGSRYFDGRVTIVTTDKATLSFNIDGIDYNTPAALADFGAIVTGPTAVIGNSKYQTYVIKGLTGNVAVTSTGELYLAAYGSSVNATFGGFYSGFTFKPEISFGKLDPTKSGCIPNTKLAVNTLSPFYNFQWYLNDLPISGAKSSSHTPLTAGYYHVSATSGCGNPIISDKIPVSDCPIDTDKDGVNNNIDLDNDNDGIANCTESFGNQNFNLTNTTGGTIDFGTYTNQYIGTKTFSGTGIPSSASVKGDTNGNLVTEATKGKNNTQKYKISNFSKPISLTVEYPSSALASDLFTSSTEIRITCPENKTLTILNPKNQLLIDTNYDGIFESDITSFSSFEIRFRLNSDVPLAAGLGTFSIKGDLVDAITFSNINLSDTRTSRVALRLYASCVPKDSDNDTIADQLDLDNDNDTIPDYFEAQGENIIAYSKIDANNNGIDDAFGSGVIPVDSDKDGIPNIADLDSDNDGIYDLSESGSNTSASLNGVADGNFGTNGLLNSVETTPDSGKLKDSISDTDGDKKYNYLDLDSDNDVCSDVVEAGYSDSNNDGFLGTTPLTVNANGIVTSGTGYGTPHSNYLIPTPIIITTQPKEKNACELQSATFLVVSSTATSYEWEVSTDNGTTWNAITDGPVYSGKTSANLTITSVPTSMNGYQYRVFLNRAGNICGLYSSVAVLNVNPLPVINSPISLQQCDEDSDGIATFNLTQKNDVISADHLNHKFTYFTDSSVANLIANPFAYTSANKSVFARVQNSNGCISVGQMDLIVSSTQLPASFQPTIQYGCDNYIDSNNTDTDGVSSFNFDNITTSILKILPSPNSNYNIHYYKNEADFFAETDPSGNSLAIPNPSNYTNIGYPYQQTIWVRVESIADNSCYGVKTFDIAVKPLPKIDLETKVILCLPGTQATINAGILDGTPTSNYTYQWYQNDTIMSGKKAPTLTVNTPNIYSVKVMNVYGCSNTRTINVAGSEIASIQSIDVIDLADLNSILVSANGSGDYEFSLDDKNGPYQDSNLFENVPIGWHDIYIRDKNGCGLLGPIPVAVLGILKFFTPNGDGFNDYWNVKGVSAQSNSQSTIYIFDRYGKLVKQIDALSSGWDGTYDGKEMPADDYWYSIKFEDGRIAKGHFTLKR